ncbi:MAG: AAA family ATPase [Flavobacteriales bacterium]|jgi:exodeoxyribonuclease-5|nr:AAA family ATPase [Flavobacteriales bacterium]
MSRALLEETVKYNLPFDPTAEQELLIAKVSGFSLKDTSLEIFVLSGYAGTGKTSILGALAKAYTQLQQKFVLLAPTGRAAKVLQGKTKKYASTIHKHIYQTKVDGAGITSFARKANKAQNIIYIVDEASMIHHHAHEGQSVLDDLIQYVFSGRNNKLLLVGDQAQLPPVGAQMSIALDAEELRTTFWRNLDFFNLQDVQRQKKESDILWSATNIRESMSNIPVEIPQLKSNKKDCFRHEDRFELEYAIEKSYNLNGEDETVLLCRSNKRANQYNQRIRYHFFGKESVLEKDDLIMVVKNNYFWLDQDSPAGFIANGDMAKIVRVKKYIEEYGFEFAVVELKLIDYPQMDSFECHLILDTLTKEAPALSYEEMRTLYFNIMEDYQHLSSKRKKFESIKKNPFYNALQIKFAYAITCHKSQGGQWKEVFVEQPFWDIDQIEEGDLKWLYTAVTRASDKVHFIGFKEDFFE